MRDQRVDAAARADVRALLKASSRIFGAQTRRRYKALLDRAFALLRENPNRPGVQQREELPPDYFLFHLKHARSRGVSPKQPRHFILFRYDDERVYILRVLHDSMDIARHVSEDESEL